MTPSDPRDPRIDPQPGDVVRNREQRLTTQQVKQFNQMIRSLKIIAKDYKKPDWLRRNSEKLYGLEYEEALEMAYENIQNLASISVRGVRPIEESDASC